ncbi:MAG: hypothetical protein IT578_05795 [Verrucomicrobiae bacterium]|nr:hypothetical protein [Verrucomicrobiae bacterium]
MSLERSGYVGLFRDPWDRTRVEALVRFWLERFGAVEQTAGVGPQSLTLVIKAPSDVIRQKDLQFRVLSGSQFAWVYLTTDRRVAETTGLVSEDAAALCRDVLAEAPGCLEVIHEKNEARLDQLEKLGLM